MNVPPSTPLFLCFLLLCIPCAYSETPKIKVGIYYYVWYDPDSPDAYYNWSYPTHQDKPILGYYNSGNITVINQHLEWWNDLKIDFVIISWWGIGNHIDNNAKLVYECAKNQVSNIKFCLMVEDFNQSGIYDYKSIYDYVYENYILPYYSLCFIMDNKPLILFWNAPNLTDFSKFQYDDRFTVKFSGHFSFCNFVYSHFEGYEPYQSWKNNKFYDIPYCRMYPLCPRYDDFYVRYPNYTINKDLSLPIYENEWKDAIKYAKANKIDIVTIATWNEFPERTAIEPHYDRDAWNNDPYYLYNLTKQYIAQIKGESIPSIEKWYEDPKNYAIVIGTILFGIILGKWFFDRI
ncbi:MAG: hypothetical protein QXJ53_01275 [Candidatus Bathyarchaeia archaeon]